MCLFRNSLDRTSLLIWDSMSNDKKAAFVNEAQRVKGLHMRAKMCAAVNQELESHFCSWLQLTMFHEGNGSLKTLRDMIRIGPEQFEGMRDRYSMSEDSTAKKRKLELDTILCPKEILPKQRLKLNDWLIFMRTSGDTLERLDANIDGLGNWIAPIAKDNLGSLRCSYHTNKEIYDKVMETGECNDFPGFIQSMRSFKQQFKTHVPKLEKLVKDAASFYGKQIDWATATSSNSS